MKFLQELLVDYHPRDFEIKLWDGTRWQPDAGQFRRFTWKINSPTAVRSVFTSASQLALAEAYICNDFDIDGDIESIFPLADYFSNLSSARKLHLGALLLTLPASPNHQRSNHAP